MHNKFLAAQKFALAHVEARKMRSGLPLVLGVINDN
jgi:hypothetical protein